MLRAGFSFFAGCLVYDLRLRSGSRLTAPNLWEAGCLVLVIAFAVTTRPGGWQYAFPLVAMIMIYVFSFDQGAVSTVLRCAALQKLGLWSYSIYMIHTFIFHVMKMGASFIGQKTHLQLVGSHNDEKLMLLGTPQQAVLPALILSVVLVVPVAAFSYRLIEKPAMDVARQGLSTDKRGSAWASPDRHAGCARCWRGAGGAGQIAQAGVTRCRRCASFPAQTKGEAPTCTTPSSSAAARPARSWPTGSPPRAPTRSCSARRARTRRPATSRPRSATAIPGTAYFDPRFHWTELKVTTQIVSHNNPKRTARRCANTSRRACWAAAPRSTARWPIAARRPTTTNGRRAAPRAGAGTTCCPISRRSSATSISTGRSTARTAASRSAAFRGSTGPGIAQAVAEACKLAGYAYLPDQNGEFVDGYFPVTHSNQDEQRVSAAMGYLDRETRKRANLTISTDTQVKELLFEGTRCVGVKALVDGREQEFRGREVILSCGAIHSPAHLLRAGIGPVGHLKEMGIPVLMGLAGVGQRLMDHPSISLSSFIRRGARMNEHTRRHIQLGLRYSSGLAGAPPATCSSPC